MVENYPKYSKVPFELLIIMLLKAIFVLYLEVLSNSFMWCHELSVRGMF